MSCRTCLTPESCILRGACALTDEPFTEADEVEARKPHIIGHVVSMRGPGNAPRGSDGSMQSLAVCECGWRNSVPWGEYERQDAAVAGHWAQVREAKAKENQT